MIARKFSIRLAILLLGLWLLVGCAQGTGPVVSGSPMPTQRVEEPTEQPAPAPEESLRLPTPPAEETPSPAPTAEETPAPTAEETPSPTPSHTPSPTLAIPQTGMTDPVPAAYTRPCDRPGSVQRLVYDSRDYAGSGAAIVKTAYVYLPYGYDEADASTRYDILYLMHGWTGHAGEFFQYGAFKNILDHLIANGDTPPMIVVSPSFYTENSRTDFDASMDALRLFYLDFEAHLMPAVEGRYFTYAASTSDDDLKASRDHRAFGGFSMGAVTTWLMLCHDSDYIRYYLPMSGACFYYGDYDDYQTARNVDHLESVVRDEDLNDRGYFVYHAVGTLDAYREQSVLQAEEMLARGAFPPEHYVFYQRKDGRHDRYSVDEFLYNALPLFFR